MKTLDAGDLGTISRVGLGTWQFGSSEWGYGAGYAGEEARLIVRRAIELGVNFFDTAEIYGWGRSERILAEALGDDRDQWWWPAKSSRWRRSRRWSGTGPMAARNGCSWKPFRCTRCISPTRWSPTR